MFLKARESANKTVCVSNLRQIGLALQMYETDNSGVLPKKIGDASSIPLQDQLKDGTSDDLASYLHDPNLYHCPDRGSPLPGPDAPYFRDDYQYRVQTLLQFQDANGQPEAIIKPEPSSVLAYDFHHLPGRDLTYLVLRANGAVSYVPMSHTAGWNYMPDGHWLKEGHSLFDETVFPGEPWPPQFEK